MKIQNKFKTIIVIFVFIFIFGIFLYSANIEYERAVMVQQRFLQNHIVTLATKINQVINQSIRNAMGVVAYVKMNPEITEDEFILFSKNLIPKTDKIISSLSLLEDTTIKYVYPVEGNEKAIGVDLSKIETQRDEVLRIKKYGISELYGPVNLVQGGKGLINRMPIFLNDGKYFGQLSLVLKFDEILKYSGINDFSKNYNIKVEQIEQSKNNSKIIFSNIDKFQNEAIQFELNIDTGIWRITAEYKNGYNGKTVIFYFLIILGLFFAVVISILINNLLLKNIELNNLVDKRTKDIKLINENLEKSLKELSETQEKLILREKLAALGELVAGVAHEMNTPLGICITLNSYMENIILKLDEKFENNTLKRSELNTAIKDISDSVRIMSLNLEKTSELVVGFKKLSVDQSVEEKKKIDFKKYLQEIIDAISPILIKNKCHVNIEVDENLKFETYPGIISQIFTNLIMNSIVHGFEKKEEGKIFIKIRLDGSNIIIDYYDNGKGISKENIEKVFNPFFTTKRNEGNIGLGMHIVFNIVNQNLSGNIRIIDDVDKGVHFEIIFPIE